MNDKVLEILERENEELLNAIKHYRDLLKKTKEENFKLRKILLDKGIRR